MVHVWFCMCLCVIVIVRVYVYVYVYAHVGVCVIVCIGGGSTMASQRPSWSALDTNSQIP